MKTQTSTRIHKSSQHDNEIFLNRKTETVRLTER